MSHKPVVVNHKTILLTTQILFAQFRLKLCQLTVKKICAKYPNEHDGYVLRLVAEKDAHILQIKQLHFLSNFTKVKKT